MATILLVEETPDLGAYEAGMLEAEGHRVLRCGGGPSPLAACPMLRTGWCSLADAADLIVFACALIVPIRGRTYTGADLLRAYRRHTAYSRKPMLVISVGTPGRLDGTGPLETIQKFSSPELVLDAVARLLAARTEEVRT